MTNIAAQLRAMGTSNTVPDMERMDKLLIAAAEEIEGNRAALKVAQQSLLEFSHAQECGPSWYTRGERGMYAQVRLWLDRGLTAVKGALGPYDDNGQYLKEKSAVESPELPKDYAEVVLRVEIVSDTLHKVEEFTKFLANVILETPSDAGADVMVTIHRDGELPVFEANRAAVKSATVSEPSAPQPPVQPNRE